MDEIKYDDDELSIETFTTKQKTKEKITKKLKFNVQYEDGMPSLWIQENDGKKKMATKHLINKYKRDVLETVLSYYWNYHDKKKTKTDLLSILCGIYGIETDNVDELIDELFTDDIIKNIMDFMMDQEMSLLVNIREFVINDSNSLYNVNDNWHQCYFDLFINNESTFESVIIWIWNQICNLWQQNQTDILFDKHFVIFTSQYLETTEMKTLRTEFDKLDANCEFEWFAYGISLNAKLYFISLLRSELIKIAMDQSSNDVVIDQDAQSSNVEMSLERKKYLVYSMGGAVCNSLFRRYYGRNFGATKRNYLIQIVRYMLLNYQSDDIEQKEIDIPHRLYLENRGGLRIIDKSFLPLIETVVDMVADNFENLLSKTKGDLTVILDNIINNIDEESFTGLFDYNTIIKAIIALDNKIDDDEEDDDIHIDVDINENDDEEYGKCLHKIFVEFTKGLVTRCLWSYLKRIQPNQHTLTLRNKLQIHHLTTQKKHLSLQPDTN